MNKKMRAFTLIELIIALGLLAIIAASLFPSIKVINEENSLNKKEIQITYALEQAIEKSKDNDVGFYEINSNNLDIEVEIIPFSENLKEIRASFDDYELKLVRRVKSWKKEGLL